MFYLQIKHTVYELSRDLIAKGGKKSNPDRLGARQMKGTISAYLYTA